tara:strand:+ start:7160 stop:7855 length:696 start_codon:yes stop_codon:yes gene_type:complete
MKKYIRKNSTKAQKELKEFYLYDKPVYIMDELSPQVDVNNVLGRIKQLVPSTMVNNIDTIYIGRFERLFNDANHLNALYKDGAIYVSNTQDNEKDMIDDIVHELAHSLEKENYDHLFADDAVEREFLAKRKYLYHLLPKKDRANMIYFLNPDYDSKFDNYLYKDIGYVTLRNMSSELFYSPYAVTSLKEYWANGFENYVLGDRKKLKEISPVLYTKINTLYNHKREEANGI